MKILFVTSEIAPWVKTGGLGDVAAALPVALRGQGVELRVLTPCYPALRAAFPQAQAIAWPQELGGLLPACAVLEAVTPDGTVLWLVDHPPFFERAGNPYLSMSGANWADNALRFGLLSRVAAWLGSSASTLAWQPDVIHCNDWQSALAPAYLHYLALAGGRAKSLLTIHNLAFQGVFPASTLTELGLPPAAWHMNGVEFHGQLSFLKAGLQWADAITTVSPTYAQEICTEAEGMGLDGLLRHRADALCGIVNGIDEQAWNPATDAALAQTYDAQHLADKRANTRALRRQCGLQDDDTLPLIGVVSRFTAQKGLDLLAEIADEVIHLPAQLVLLGSGDAALEAAFRALAKKHPGRMALTVGFDEALAHRIEAGADLFLMPSRFEPCGLNQMYSQRYGTPPIVRATGGLADTVVDAANRHLGSGFVFAEASPAALLAAIARAINVWRDKKRWKQIQLCGMARDFSWAVPARRYVDLYARIAG